jgi:putative transposase
MRFENGTVRHLRRSIDLPGHAHELTFCTYQGYKLLSKDRTRVWFIDALQRARRMHEFQIWAYVIMPEHVHLLILPERDDYKIGRILKSVKLSVAKRAVLFLEKTDPVWLERLTVRCPNGDVERHFWQPGGGYDRNIISAKALRSAIHYIHANPVRRGLCAQVDEWNWSSAKWWSGLEDVPLAMDGVRSTSF